MYAYTMRAWVLIAPVAILGIVQLSGCTTTSPKSSPDPAPPGGIYRSSSAGALFEQSVTLTNPAEDTPPYIAQYVFRGSHRPTFSPDAIYVAASNQGYVVSHDDGQTWQHVAVPLASVLDIVALEKGIVVVTGIDGEGQGYILRSADEGKSWQTVVTVPVPSQKSGPPGLVGQAESVATIVISIAPDPFDPNRIYAGTSLGNVFIGEQFAKTWRKVHNADSDAFSGNQAKFSVADIIPSPHVEGDFVLLTSGGRLYYVASGGDQKEIKVPQNTSDRPVISIGQSKVILSAFFVPQFPEALILGVSDGAVISRDRGETWQQLTLPVDTIKRFNTSVVRVSPTNPNRILIAINDAVYRSEDGGVSWNTFSLSLANHIIIDLLINPSNAAHVIAVTTPGN